MQVLRDAQRLLEEEPFRGHSELSWECIFLVSQGSGLALVQWQECQLVYHRGLRRHAREGVSQIHWGSR